MKKLSLKLDDLSVDTFSTAPGEGGSRGTVAGHYGTTHTMQATACDTCARQWTAEGTCDDTCGPPDTCGHAYCGTYPNVGCPNSYWFCTDCQVIC